MITSFKVKPDSFEEAVLFFKEADLTQFQNHVIPLFGPNGVGKSTLIKALESKKVDVKTDKPTLFFSYQNARDNFKVREARTYMESFDLAFLNSKFDAKAISEGQSIIYSMFDLLDGLKPTGELKPEEGKDMLIVLDEIDSGMSIDNIDITMKKIKWLVKHRSDLQFIMSFNSPRVVKHFPQVLSMYDGKMIELHTDEDMLEEIDANKNMFNKARKTSKGRPKIFN